MGVPHTSESLPQYRLAPLRSALRLCHAAQMMELSHHENMSYVQNGTCLTTTRLDFHAQYADGGILCLQICVYESMTEPSIWRRRLWVEPENGQQGFRRAWKGRLTAKRRLLYHRVYAASHAKHMHSACAFYFCICHFLQMSITTIPPFRRLKSALNPSIG